MLMEGLLQNERKHMKALVYTSANKVTYRDEPSPEPATGEAKILIDAVGICGSDMHADHGEDARRVLPLNSWTRNRWDSGFWKPNRATCGVESTYNLWNLQ